MLDPHPWRKSHLILAVSHTLPSSSPTAAQEGWVGTASAVPCYLHTSSADKPGAAICLWACTPKEVKLDADLVSLGAATILTSRTWTLLPLLQLQGANHSTSSLQLPHLAFNITFYLNTLMNIKDKHFDGQWEYQSITCYCLLDHIYCRRTNTGWFSATAMPQPRENIRFRGFDQETLHPQYPVQNQCLHEGFFSPPESKQKTSFLL